MIICLNTLETKKKTEFELLLSGQDFDDSSDTYNLSQILEQRLASAVTAEINSVLNKNPKKTTTEILQNLCSKIPSTIFTKYERAGKNYITIEHKMGDSGNLFFGELFTRSGTSPRHTITQQNKVCFIFRQ
jgi:hypothetical protein